jgi:hypothetical protein
LRKAVFQKLVPKPLTSRELGYFVIGNGHHVVLECLHGAQREVEREWRGIIAHLDLLERIPTEIKTTRSGKRGIQAIPGHWVRQLGFYCVIAKTDSGKLIIVHLNSERTPKNTPKTDESPFETYVVEFPSIEAVSRDLLQRRDRYVMALNAKNAALAPRTEIEDKWLCSSCQFRCECDTLEVATQ